jgi:uncharacterized metal-binding protein
VARQINSLPLVYSCSGCSSAAQLANSLALRLARDGEARMSCIAGVGAGLRNFVQQATSGRPILGLDGCPLACVRNSLKRHGVEPDRYVQLQKYGIKKRYGKNAAEEDVARLYPRIVELARELRVERAPLQAATRPHGRGNRTSLEAFEDEIRG